MVCFELLSLTVFLSQDGRTALHVAAGKGHLPVVDFLFECAPQLIEMRTNVSVDVVCFELLSLTVFVSQKGITALHFAAQEGHLPLVELLFERAPQLIEMLTNVSAAWCVLCCSL
jgi:ankyrin repeat protein